MIDLALTLGVIERLYTQPIRDIKLFESVEGGFVQDTSVAARSKLLRQLPLSLQGADNIQDRIRQVVSRTSRSQTVKGLITAGVLKSAVYGLRKIRKAIL